MEHPIVISNQDQIGKFKPPGVRRSLDYMGIARRAITIPPQPVEYDTEIDISAVILAFEHDVIQIDDRDNIGTDSALNRVFGRRVTVPSFEIFANPSIKISEVKRRRFNVIDRAVQKTRYEIMAQEDDAIFKALDAAGKSGNKDI